MFNNEPKWIDIDVVANKKNQRGEPTETGTRYVGRFKMKKFLTLREKHDMSLLANNFAKGFLGGSAAILESVAMLRFHIVEMDENAKAWFDFEGKEPKALELYDTTPVDALFNKLFEWRKEDMVKNKEESEETSQPEAPKP